MPRSDFTPRRYLVTGGCGFIGSHLADALVKLGHEVVILDNLSTGKRTNAPKEATVIIGDTTHYETVERAIQNVHGCFHLAAIASVEKSTLEWAQTHTVNVTSTVNILQAASRMHSPIPIVYASSAAVYGNNDRTPIPESVLPMPLTAYGADKLGCDLHAYIAWHIHRVPTLGFRPFNVYGPRQDPSSPYSGVISIFADRIKRGSSITIYGDGKQVRDFVYVGDAVQALIEGMNRLREGHDRLNLCTGRATSINDLASILETIVGYKIERQYLPARRGDIRISVGDPTKLYSRLQLKLTTPLAFGLLATIDENQLEAA